MSWAAVLLAAALLVGADPARVRIRAGLTRSPVRRHPPVRSRDPLAVASSLDVLAACLASGMAVSSAAARGGTVGATVTGAGAAGAPPICWRWVPIRRPRGRIPVCRWTTTARRCCGWRVDRRRRARRWHRGSPNWPTRSRHDAADAAGAAAERASVLIAGPLGLCYLPAFLCLGIVPVVAGLAGDVLRSGLV